MASISTKGKQLIEPIENKKKNELKAQVSNDTKEQLIKRFLDDLCSLHVQSAKQKDESRGICVYPNIKSISTGCSS